MNKPNIEALEHLSAVLTTTRNLVMHAWCGCAVGQVQKDPWFAKHGFIMDCGRVPTYISDGRQHAGYGAVMQFFQLQHRDAVKLFGPAGYFSYPVKPKTVIARIDTLINLWETEHG